MKKIILSLITLLLTSSYLFAQNDLANIFKAGLVDMNTLGNDYLKPAGTSFAAGLGSNWYNTAKVHKTWGFDLTVGAGVVFVPPSEQMFSLTGFTNLRPTNPEVTQAPTFAGKGVGVGLDVMNGNSKVGSFPTPDGVSKYIPTASVQFTIGLPLINDLSIRLVPTVNVKGFQASLWGVGIKHNIKQWIPVVKDLPFDAAVVLAYSKFNFNYALPANSRVTPDMLVSDGASFIADPNLNDYSTQGIKMTATAQTANIVFSKKLAFVTPYVGFGITNTTYNVTSVGNFPTLGDPVQTGNTYKMQIINKSDLLNISSSEVLPNTTVGLRFQLLWILTVHAQYAFQKYPLASLGVGLTFR